MSRAAAVYVAAAVRAAALAHAPRRTVVAIAVASIVAAIRGGTLEAAALATALSAARGTAVPLVVAKDPRARHTAVRARHVQAKVSRQDEADSAVVADDDVLTVALTWTLHLLLQSRWSLLRSLHHSEFFFLMALLGLFSC